MTRSSPESESVELIERARSHAVWARRHLLDYESSDEDRSGLVRAKHLLVAASRALGAAAMDPTLPTNVTKTLVDSWAGLDAFLLAAGELDGEPSGADAPGLLARAATFLIEALPGPQTRMRVHTG